MRQSRLCRQGVRQQRRCVVGDLLTEPKPREVITIYEIDATGQRNSATAARIGRKLSVSPTLQFLGGNQYVACGHPPCFEPFSKKSVNMC